MFTTLKSNTGIGDKSVAKSLTSKNLAELDKWLSLTLNVCTSFWQHPASLLALVACRYFSEVVKVTDSNSPQQ